MVAPDKVAAPHLLHRHLVARLRVRVEAREPDGADGVQEARALGQAVVAAVLSGVLQDRLHRVRRERRVRLQHQRDRAGDDGRRHARAGEAQIRKVRRRDRAGRQGGRFCLIEVAAGRRERHGAGAGRDEIRLRIPVDEARTARAEAADDVVGTVRRPLRARAADGQHPRRVAGRADAAVLNLPRRVAAEVARGGDDHDARVDDLLRGDRQRVGPRGFVDRRADRHVDDADVVRRVIRQHPVERGDDAADGAVAVRVEHLERDQARLGGRARLLATRIVAVARDDAGDVRAVAVVVVGLRPAVHEVHELRHALIAVGIQHGRGVREVVVPRRDAGVDHGNADAGARKAEHLANHARADRHRRPVVEFRGGTIVVDAEHRRMLRHLAEQPIGQIDDLSVDDPELPLALRERGELRRQLRAGHELDDHTGRARLAVGRRAGFEFCIELIRGSARVGVPRHRPPGRAAVQALRGRVRHEGDA